MGTFVLDLSAAELEPQRFSEIVGFLIRSLQESGSAPSVEYSAEEFTVSISSDNQHLRVLIYGVIDTTCTDRFRIGYTLKVEVDAPSGRS